MQAPDKIRGKRDDFATASGMTEKKKRYLMLKRRSGRQACRKVKEMREGMAAAIGMTACRQRKKR